MSNITALTGAVGFALTVTPAVIIILALVVLGLI